MAAQTPHEQWLQSVAQLNETATSLLQQYVLGINAELSYRAGYKALGMDPRDAPDFGWGLLSTSRGAATASVNMPAPAPVSPPVAKPVRKSGGGWFWKVIILILLAFILLTAGGAGAWYLARPPASQPGPPAPSADAEEYDLILERDGKEISRSPLPKTALKKKSP